MSGLAQPLAGRVVLDLGAYCEQLPHLIGASFAAKLCRDFGATVVRPLPEQGDALASLPPLLPDGTSALDRFVNAGKHHRPPPAHCDVVIGDTPALATHTVSAQVQVRLSVFGPGEDPPMSELGLLALAGLLGVVGDETGPPAPLAGHQAAYAAGLAAFTGLLAALRLGQAEIVDVSLFDVAAWLNWKVAASALVTGRSLERGPMASDWYTLPAADGHIALVYQDKDWPALCDMIGDARLHESRFASRNDRLRHSSELRAVLAPWFAARPRAVITREAQARRIPIGPVLFPVELLDDAQYRARGFLGADGTPRLPINWDGQRLEHVA